METLSADLDICPQRSQGCVWKNWLTFSILYVIKLKYAKLRLVFRSYSILLWTQFNSDILFFFKVLKRKKKPTKQLIGIDNQLVSGENVQDALRVSGYSSVQLDISKKGPFEVICGSLRVNNTRTNRSFLKQAQLQFELVRSDIIYRDCETCQ